MTTKDEPQPADLLYGAPAVARHLGNGMTERQARYLMERGTIPSFKLGGKVCASRSDVDAWIAAKIEEGRQDAKRRAAEREAARQKAERDADGKARGVREVPPLDVPRRAGNRARAGKAA